ncbi:MAG: TRAP transporter large permease subunit, partial [Betaproteobacteria bacterium]|nr:TRAP transporter large permease subunit [Betaproteobacteria bacterium]
MIEALVGLAAFLLLAFLRVPMAFSMGLVGFFGVAYKLNFAVAASMIAQTTYETGLAYTLSVIPLFILMGNFVVRARMSEELYHAAYTFLSHRRGGLAMSTIVASAGFGSICGSSIATAATFAKVAYPSMRKYRYNDALAVGSIAAGGTLGILIPPSVIMVIYGIMTETNIGKLFVAGILPGTAATILLCLAVSWITWRDPAAGPPAEPHSWDERLAAFRRVWAVLALFIGVIGGIYGGVFTATEGAGIGAGGAF